MRIKRLELKFSWEKRQMYHKIRSFAGNVEKSLTSLMALKGLKSYTEYAKGAERRKINELKKTKTHNSKASTCCMRLIFRLNKKKLLLSYLEVEDPSFSNIDHIGFACGQSYVSQLLLRSVLRVLL